MANATASESGTNKFCATPVIRNEGRKTATTESIDRKRGKTVRCVA